MRAAIITAQGGPEVLEVRHDVPAPVAGPFEVLIRVRASALNRADLLQRRGLYNPPVGVPADVPGLELAGRVEAVGPHVSRFRPGDEVMGIVGGGACAELVVMHEREAIRCPRGLDLLRAAAIPEAFVTAFDAAVVQAGLTSGQWLAVDAVGSGVGTAAVQIARAIGARSVGSTRTKSKLDRALQLGLDSGVVGTTEALAGHCREVTGEGAAVGLELVGGPSLEHMLKALRPRGKLVLVGLMGGLEAKLFLPAVLKRRLQIIGTVLRSRPPEEKLAVAQQFSDQMVPLFEGDAPRLVPVIDTVFSLDAIADAHRYMESNSNFGKIVLDHDA